MSKTFDEVCQEIAQLEGKHDEHQHQSEGQDKELEEVRAQVTQSIEISIARQNGGIAHKRRGSSGSLLGTVLCFPGSYTQ